MHIIKRSKGAIVATFVAGPKGPDGKVAIAPKVVTPPPVEKSAAKESKSGDKAAKPRLPQPPKDASPGAKLAFKLAAALTLADAKDRNEECYKLGKFANEIGPGDPDVWAALDRARKDQASYRVNADEIDLIGRECVEGSAGAWSSWSAAFIAGYRAKVNAKGTPTIKKYLLTVRIEGQEPNPGKLLDRVDAEDFTGKFEKFGDAHRAAIRWYTVKSDVAHLMRVTIDTIDLTVPPVPGSPPAIIESLRTVVSLAEARTVNQAVERRANKGPTMFAPKQKGGLRFGVKVKESRCEFSRG